ncbi:MAG: hypothetical protein ABI353_06260, partial [Isosphaeraceae bacterium]
MMSLPSSRRSRRRSEHSRAARPQLETLEDRRLLANVFHDFEIPADFGRLTGGITGGSDGNIWVTGTQGDIGRITPGGQFQSFSQIDFQSNLTHALITTGPDGNLWTTYGFTDELGNSYSDLVRTTTDGVSTIFYLGYPPTADVAAGPDGTVLVTIPRSSVTRYTRISLGYPIGAYITIADATYDYYPTIDRVTTDGKIKSSSTLAPGANMAGVVAVADGNIWFTEGANVPRIGRLTPDGQFSEYDLPSGNLGATAITIGPDGNPWFVESAIPTPDQPAMSQIATIAPDAHITQVGPTFYAAGAPSLTTGPDGNLWFLTPDVDNSQPDFRGRVGRLTPGGAISYYAMPAGIYTSNLIAGPDGNLWLTEYEGQRDMVGQMVLADLIHANGLPPNVDAQGAVVGPLASIDTAEMNPDPAGFVAKVDWGDGSAASPGVVVRNAQGALVVQGSHTYAEAGQHTVTVTIKDAGGATATATTSAFVP